MMAKGGCAVYRIEKENGITIPKRIHDAKFVKKPINNGWIEVSDSGVEYSTSNFHYRCGYVLPASGSVFWLLGSYPGLFKYPEESFGAMVGSYLDAPDWSGYATLHTLTAFNGDIFLASGVPSDNRRYIWRYSGGYGLQYVCNLNPTPWWTDQKIIAILECNNNMYVVKEYYGALYIIHNPWGQDDFTELSPHLPEGVGFGDYLEKAFVYNNEIYLCASYGRLLKYQELTNSWIWVINADIEERPPGNSSDIKSIWKVIEYNGKIYSTYHFAYQQSEPYYEVTLIRLDLSSLQWIPLLSECNQKIFEFNGWLCWFNFNGQLCKLNDSEDGYVIIEELIPDALEYWELSGIDAVEFNNDIYAANRYIPGTTTKLLKYTPTITASPFNRIHSAKWKSESEYRRINI